MRNDLNTIVGVTVNTVLGDPNHVRAGDPSPYRSDIPPYMVKREQTYPLDFTFSTISEDGEEELRRRWPFLCNLETNVVMVEQKISGLPGDKRTIASCRVHLTKDLNELVKCAIESATEREHKRIQQLSQKLGVAEYQLDKARLALKEELALSWTSRLRRNFIKWLRG